MKTEKATLRYEVPFFQVPDELVKDERTGVYHLAMFCAIAMHANKQGCAWPSINRLAKLTGMSRRKAIDVIEELQALGWLKVIHRQDEIRGGNASNIYELQHSLHGGSAHGALGGVHEVHGGSAHGAPKPDPIEPDPIELEKNTLPRKSAPVPMKDNLARWIDERFLKEGEYAAFGKERAQVKRIASLCRSRQPDNPQGYAEAMVEGFAWLIENDKETYWKSQPFTPSRLISIWAAVEQKMKVHTSRNEQARTMHEKDRRAQEAGF